MLRAVLFLVILSLSPPTASVSAQTTGMPMRSSDFYIGGSGAIAYFAGIEGAEYDLGFAISGLVGFEFMPNWRAELDLSYEAAEFENSVDETSLFRMSGSLYADLNNWGDWVPYVGGGAGIVNVDVGNDKNNTELSAHAEAGFSVPLGGALDLVPGLRVEYIDLGNIDDQIITQVRAGLRWHL